MKHSTDRKDARALRTLEERFAEDMEARRKRLDYWIRIIEREFRVDTEPGRTVSHRKRCTSRHGQTAR
jgi:hypothetical protein